MSKRLRKKRATLDRAASGGALMYVPAGMAQSTLGQTYYGSSLKNTPVGQTSLFSPGQPLPTQPGVNPGGLPVQWKFPISVNTFPNDRSLGNPDIPSFEQLKRLAQMDYGIGLCERYWLDMVPRMTLKISLTPEAIAGGAEESKYQKQITYFKNFFTTPDASNGVDMHSWLRSALINQSRYDELYLYKNKTRGGKLLGIEVIDGSQMKPLLDDWGRLPTPPAMAYQQYPWGIPGWQYRQDQMVHYRETPASDTPYGFSRIERIILITNLALRKQKMDLAHFTEGNIPAGMLMPPEGSNWTPDQLDAYEQSWNALIAGNLQQLARIKVTQPGFKYTPFVQPNFDSVFDKFMLNIRTAAYGMTMADLGFTETVNKSSGESQENVTYRRTIGPIASIYAAILTDVMRNDFPPEMHGELFMVGFGGYEEAEDLASTATAYTTLTNAGILGISNAGKLMKLPEDPDAPHIGRIIVTKDGPIFLDDMASDDMRQAAVQAKMAGFQMAANPPEPGDNPTAVGGKPANENETQSQEGKDDNEQGAPKNAKAQEGSARKPGRADSSTATRSAESGDRQYGGEWMDPKESAVDYRRWRARAIEDARAGKKQRGFTSTYIPERVHDYLSQLLSKCSTPDEVRTVFTRAQTQESEIIGGTPLLEYNPKLDIWEASDIEQQLAAMRSKGGVYLKWGTGNSASGSCPLCGRNDGETRKIGEPFPSGHRAPQCHNSCQCGVTLLNAEKKVMQ